MNYITIFKNQRTTRDIRESRPPISGVGMTSVVVGKEEIVFNVAVEQDELAEMARRAARNQSQKSKFGALLVEVVTRKRL